MDRCHSGAMPSKIMSILQPVPVYPLMSKRQLRELRKVFDLFDRNPNGWITIHELCHALKRLGMDGRLEKARQMFAFAIHRDNLVGLHNKRISFQEWVEATHCSFDNMRQALNTVSVDPPRAPIERFQESGTAVDPGGLIGGLFKVKKKQGAWNLAS